MQFVTNLIGWNVLTQIALIVSCFMYPLFITVLYVLYRLAPVYFYFLVVAFLALSLVIWTVLSSILGIRKLGVQAKRASMREGA